jgi:hypothetical protein
MEDETTDSAMTVTQLIVALQQMPSDALVITEGCDCYGDAGSVELVNGKVEIKRVE